MSQQQITAVVFDLGGVLIDWDPRYLYRQLFTDPAEMEDFLTRICTPDWHHAHDLGEDIAESCRRLARRYPGHNDMIMVWAERCEEMAAGQFDEAVGVLRAAGLADDAHVFTATRSGLADVRVMVAAAWDLAAIEEQYERFIDEFRAEAPADLLARLIELVHAWRRFPSIDPVLPRELLPGRWSGLPAAQLFADRRQRWSADARLDWKRLNDIG